MLDQSPAHLLHGGPIVSHNVQDNKLDDPGLATRTRLEYMEDGVLAYIEWISPNNGLQYAEGEIKVGSVMTTRPEYNGSWPQSRESTREKMDSSI